MAVDINNLIGTINPKVFCENAKEIEEAIEQSLSSLDANTKANAYLDASKIVKLKQGDYIDIMDTRLSKNAFKLEGIKNPIEDHKLSYDVSMQSIEQIYFWILDYIGREYGKGAEKLIDNFISSPSSGHFSEIQGRATRMQEEAMKIFQTANTVLRSVLNIVYDLKEFKLRIQNYDEYHSKDEAIKQRALLSLKQIWLDQVDIKKGGTSIKQLSITGANQPNFVTLIDAFMAADSSERVETLNLNDRIKRIVRARVAEFFKWLEESEVELKKRFEIEKKYLKAQVSSLQLYARWAKPYLKSARQLEQSEYLESAELVNSFNTAIFQLVLLGKDEFNPAGDILEGNLPKVFTKLIEDKKIRTYCPLAVVDLKFRSIPDRSDQRGGYTFRGKVIIRFTSYALNMDELEFLKKQIEKDDIGDVMKLISGSTTESLGDIQKDIDEFLGTSKKEEEIKKEEKSEDINPFKALFSFLKSDKKEDKKDPNKITKDSDYEKAIRSQALLEARWKCRKLYDSYKKSIGMSAFAPIQ